MRTAILRNEVARPGQGTDCRTVASLRDTLLDVRRSPGQPFQPSPGAFPGSRCSHDFSGMPVRPEIPWPGLVEPRISPNRSVLQREVRGRVEPGEIRAWQPRPSDIIPDLDRSTVDQLIDLVRHGQSAQIRQQLIDLIVADRQRKREDFRIVRNGKPTYVETYPRSIPGDYSRSNGITVPPRQIPECPGDRPCVYIGPTAFGGADAQERVVRLYSSVMHELQHARQWQQPAAARALGTAGREVDAFFWEIENAHRTGLLQQRGPLQSVWEEALRHWRAFRGAPEWRQLTPAQRQAYMTRFEGVSAIVRRASGGSR